MCARTASEFRMQAERRHRSNADDRRDDWKHLLMSSTGRR